jgi:hypothetical protein
LLPRAHAELLAQAGTIADETVRQSFLACTPHRREIVALQAATLS